MSGVACFIAGWVSCGAAMVLALGAAVATADRRDRAAKPEPAGVRAPEPLYVPREWVGVTAHLHLAPGIEPVGAHMADLAVLWAQLATTGPSLHECCGVEMSPTQGGTITAHLADRELLLAWADHLGLAFKREHVAGRTHQLVATGHITRGTRSAVVVLRAFYIDRSTS